MDCKLMKKSAKTTGVAAVAGSAGLKVGDFILIDNQDDSFTVFGVDAAGNQVDISQVATLSASSSDTTKLTVDAPTGMTSKMHAVGPIGTATLHITATWNDGSIGPFTIDFPVDIQTGPATGLVIVPGTPTVH